MRLPFIFFLLVSMAALSQQKNRVVNIGDVFTKEKQYVVFSQESPISQLPLLASIKGRIIKDTLKVKKQKKDTLLPKTKIPVRYIYDLSITDKLSALEQINNYTALIEYAKKQPKTKIVTQVNFTTASNDLNQLAIEKPNAITLITKNKTTVINLPNKEQGIPLSDLNITDYTASYLCWGIVQKREVKIIDIVKNKCDCPKDSHVKYSKVAKPLKVSINKYLKL